VLVTTRTTPADMLSMEVETQIQDVDGLITALKNCLRTANLHLQAATLSVLPSAISRLVSRPVSSNLSRSMRVYSPSSSTSSSGPSSFIDTVTLRQLLVAFLPTGGLIERMGDKERVQLKAREALVVLGGLTFRSGASSTLSTGANRGKGPETPMAMFERFLRESGFGSKVWKVREQVSSLHCRIPAKKADW
jgi:CLIP-associating protein 1/2